jgi:hypothetical protein
LLLGGLISTVTATAFPAKPFALEVDRRITPDLILTERRL